MTADKEANNLTSRVMRYAKVGAGVGTVAAKYAGNRLLSKDNSKMADAANLAAALGQLKGPLMKVAQLISTVPDVIPPEYSEELAKLQAHAPPMGWAFTRRRMAAELGSDWQSNFREFGREAAASASLGQVHKARLLDGREVACKLQYPDMESAVEADLNQLQLILSIHRRMDRAIDTEQIAIEISERLREELDYKHEARQQKLYSNLLSQADNIVIPEIVDELSTKRLLTMQWLDGKSILKYKDRSQEERNKIAIAIFQAWWHSFARIGVIHGDPHLGNYSVAEDENEDIKGINLLDFGCIRLFPPKFVQGVINHYYGLQRNDRDMIAHAYEVWGFKGLNNDIMEILDVWARFIYGPLLEDKVRTIAGEVSPFEYGRQEAFRVHTALKEKGPVTIPREFVFMDRAAIGLGSVFIHLKAELNFHNLFNDEIDGFTVETVTERQNDAFSAVGLDLLNQ